jgi:uncharacterized protein (TIGR00730 family)|tara:strand:+ start:1158 stop:1739 length:582 start_codon:yes stop_codon:yes gene_type:complete
METICVYAGSALGSDKDYENTARKLGHMIVDSEYKMVYGGGSRGLMGIAADAVLEKGGSVTGIITEQLNDIEVGHKNLTHLEIVPTMHKRKSRMAELSGAIVSLPGGVGTWEEFYEALAWNQLGFYSKPIILLNINNYYEDLYKFTKKAVEKGFLPPKTFEDFYMTDCLDECFSVIKNFKIKNTEDWFDRLER